MTQIPVYSDSEFLGATQLNTAAGVVLAGQQEDLKATHTPGLINPSDVTVTTSGMVITFTFGSTFAALFANGFLGKPHGNTAGTDSQVYSVDLTSLVPSSGSQVVYINLFSSTVNESAYIVVGPPAGHPDYNPTFASYNAYNAAYNSLSMIAGTSAGDNVTSIYLAQTTLTAGQSTVVTSNITYTGQIYAGSILNHTGVTSGTYYSPTITVGADGRISAVANNGGVHGSAFFSASGTFTVPAGVTVLNCEAWGGGGGGGGSYGAPSGGKGGGGGGYVRAVMSVSGGQVISITVGSGGTAGASTPTNGGDGGNTIVGSFFTAYFGQGGGYGNGGFSTSGGIGGDTFIGSGLIAYDAISGGGGQLSGNVGNVLVYNGQGGWSYAGGYGPNGFQGQATAAAGSPGISHGVGGSGGVNGGAGGTGAPGYVRLWW